MTSSPRKASSVFFSLKFRFLALFFTALATSILLIMVFLGFSISRLLLQTEHADLEGDIKSSLAYIGARYPGAWKIDEEDGKLYKGKAAIDGNLDLVDEIHEFTDSQITIFKMNTRVATTIRDKDGKRIIGTKVSKIVEDRVLGEGKPYVGTADVVGTLYESAYYPLRDADGKIVGMMYVGINISTYAPEINRLRIQAFALGLIIVVIVLPLVWLLVNRTLAPLYRLMDWTRKVSSGDLNAPFASDTAIRGEVGEVSAALREMIVNLRQIIVLIHDTAGRTKQSADNLVSFSGQFASGAQDQAAAAEEASAAMEQMAASSESVSDRVSNSVQSMEAINQSLALLSRSNHEVRGSMEELTTLSRSASEKARGGEQQIHAATEAMARIQETSSKITEFVGIVTEISDRTNLLSLNAAIEAARAGEAGRGFAVVAQEITKLADRTLASAKEVTILIRASLDSIKQGTAQVDSVAGNLGGIVQDVQKIDRFSSTVMEKISLQAIDTQNIADNSTALTSTSSEILTSLSEQKRATREIETTIGNVSATAQSVSSGTNELQALANTLRSSADDLLKTVSRFKL